MDKSKTAKNVDEYLDKLSKDVREILQTIRHAIKSAAPQAQEVISYQIPTYKYNGALVHFAAFKAHCSFYVVNSEIFEIFKDELKSFHTAGTTIHFTSDQPLAGELVKKIVHLRIQQNGRLAKPKG